jgi:hypothetical protein
MSPVRPVFSEGAILGASDLTALAQLDGDRDARHARHLHAPGIASGLELTPEENDRGGVPYVDVTLQPGYAIDGNGRELVLATALPVSAMRFTADIPNPVMSEEDPELTVWYPVFISGLDAPVLSTNGQIGCQSAAGPTRIAEDVEIEFGRPGDATAEQPAPAPDAGPGDGTWRVLVGFVQLHTTLKEFVAVSTDADGVRVPTAGARAGLVAGQRGRVEVRARPTTAAGVPAVVVDADDDGGSLVFGLHDGSGAVSTLMKVDASGNLEVSGTLKGVQTSGSVLLSSGTAFDGTILPLPAGADPDAIEAGDVELSVLLTPRHPQVDTAPVGTTRFLSAECRVDDERRVHCWGSWFDPGGAAALVDRSSACDYVMLVTVPQAGA